MRDGPRNIVASVWELATTLAKAIVDPSRECVRVFKLGKQLVLVETWILLMPVFSCGIFDS